MSASRIRELTQAYSKRRAAEVMAEIPVGSGELADETVGILLERVAALEEERDQLQQRVAELEKELDGKK